MELFRFCALTMAGLLACNAAPALAVDLSGAVSGADVQRAMERGRMMLVYDRAAWVTTDDLLAKLSGERHAEVGGWIVTPAPQGVHIDYVGKGAQADKAIYSAEVVNGQIMPSLVHPANALPALSDLALRMRSAQSTANADLLRKKKWRSCSKGALNTIVLPPREDGRIPVYFMTPQTDVASYPFGGHYEIDIAGDGTVAASRAFSNSCLSMKQPKGSKDKAGLFFFVSHLLDPQPTEVHVFQQLVSGTRVMVFTLPTRITWQIDAGRITPLFALTDQAKSR